MREETEQSIQKSIIDLLRYKKFLVFKHRNVGIYRKDTQKYIPLAFGEKGISDIIACSPTGQFWAIEVKKPGGKATAEQLQFVLNVKRRGGVGMILLD